MIHSYLLLCSALEALRGQLDRAASDLRTLDQLREEALADPMAYVEKLKDEVGGGGGGDDGGLGLLAC